MTWSVVLCACGREIAHAGACSKRPTVAKQRAIAAAPSPFEDGSLLARIGQLVPRSLGAALRDDVISEMFLAVLEGGLDPARLESAATGFVSKGFAQWANKYGPRSLDEPVGHDDDRTLADLVGDGTVEHQLGDIEIGAEW